MVLRTLEAIIKQALLDNGVEDVDSDKVAADIKLAICEVAEINGLEINENFVRNLKVNTKDSSA